jgi:hypothetical protein
MEGRGHDANRQREVDMTKMRRRSKALKRAERTGKAFGSARFVRQPQEGTGSSRGEFRLSARISSSKGARAAGKVKVSPRVLFRQGGEGRRDWQRSEPRPAWVAKHPELSRGANRRGGEKPRGRTKQLVWQQAAEGRLHKEWNCFGRAILESTWSGRATVMSAEGHQANESHERRISEGWFSIPKAL